MDIEILKQELTEDEGCKYEIYLDHLGYKTFGIGHLCVATDPENDLDVGTEVSKERVNECFLEDINKVIEDCVILYDAFYAFSEAVNKNDWQEAKIQMLDSKWAKQVPNRANRLSERMGNVT